MDPITQVWSEVYKREWIREGKLDHAFVKYIITRFGRPYKPQWVARVLQFLEAVANDPVVQKQRRVTKQYRVTPDETMALRELQSERPLCYKKAYIGKNYKDIMLALADKGFIELKTNARGSILGYERTQRFYDFWTEFPEPNKVILVPEEQ